MQILRSHLQAATEYKVAARYPVPGNGGFDYVTLDATARRIYISHGTQVDVIDADTGKVTGTIADTPGVHGIALTAGHKRGFGGAGAVRLREERRERRRIDEGEKRLPGIRPGRDPDFRNQRGAGETGAIRP